MTERNYNVRDGDIERIRQFREQASQLDVFKEKEKPKEKREDLITNTISELYIG